MPLFVIVRPIRCSSLTDTDFIEYFAECDDVILGCSSLTDTDFIELTAYDMHTADSCSSLTDTDFIEFMVKVFYNAGVAVALLIQIL